MQRCSFDSWVGKILGRRDRLPTPVFMGFPGGSAGKESSGDLGLIPEFRISPRGRAWQPTPVFMPGESLWTEEPGWLECMELLRVGHN